MIPSTPATTGLHTVIVGNEAVSAPARKADCWKIIPASATSSQGTNSGERTHGPQAAFGHLDDALRQHREQRQRRTRHHRQQDGGHRTTRPDPRRQHTQHQGGAHHRGHDGPGLQRRPLLAGLRVPTMMTTASEPASTTAHSHSQRVTR